MEKDIAEEKKLSLDRDNVAIILVEPLSAGNIGSVARAMTNMGFHDLRLVNPQINHLALQAHWLAHASEKILDHAQVFPTISEAVADCALMVATSQKKTRNRQESFSSRELGSKLIPYCQQNKVAILFGRENHGLSNEEINLCTWLVNIPTATPYPSLNLSQAVMVVCYELFMASADSGSCEALPRLVGNKEMELFYKNIVEIIDMAGFRHKNETNDIFVGALRRVFGRTGLDEHEISVLYKLFSQFKILGTVKK